MTLAHYSSAYGLVDVKVYPAASGGGWGTGVDVPKVVQLGLAANIGGKILEGDDTEELHSYVKGYAGKIAFNKLSLEVLEAILGGTLADSGVTPDQVVTFTYPAVATSLGFFKLEGQITKVDSGLSDAHMVLTNCKIKPGTYEITAKYDDYIACTFDIWVQDQPIIKFNETTSSLAVSPDTAAPTISSTTPADGASGIDKTASLSVTFNEAIQAGDANDDHFILMTAAGVAVATTITINSPTNTIVTINPDSDLGGTTDYLLIVTGVHDAAGNVLAAPTIVNFTTGA